jgi:zinc protease
MVGRLFPASSPDRVPVAVANNVIGGLFTSRLNSNLRERLGYSYGVFSGPRLGRGYGALYLAGGFQARFTAASLEQILEELGAFRSGELQEGELTRSKEAIIRGLPTMLETNDAVASAMATMAHVGLPLDWYRRLPGLVSQVDAREVARVAASYFQPDRMAVIVVGPSNRQALEALGLGPLEVRATEPRSHP